MATKRSTDVSKPDVQLVSLDSISLDVKNTSYTLMAKQIYSKFPLHDVPLQLH